MPLVNRFSPHLMMHAAVLIGGGSLLLFGVFLVVGPVTPVRLDFSERQALVWDAMLSVLFFLQHSGMIRQSFRARLSAVIPGHYHPATYAIASGMVLTAVVLFWQPSQTIFCQAGGAYRWSLRAAAALAVLGFVWGVRALEDFDAFGLGPLKASLRGRPLRSPTFVARGPYLWVRHPLYFLVLVLIWSNPDISLDRLLFNVLWTFWIVLGTYLEERDLIVEFGEKYRRYQKTVPMLFPWRCPRGSG